MFTVGEILKANNNRSRAVFSCVLDLSPMFEKNPILIFISARCTYYYNFSRIFCSETITFITKDFVGCNIRFEAHWPIN